jgi:transcriptional regulator with XRE-family HTH domain
MPPSVRHIFAANLRQWRKRQNYPLKRVASDLGIAVSTWNQWETGKRFPPAIFLDRLAAYMQIAVCQLFSPHPCPKAAFHKM